MPQGSTELLINQWQRTESTFIKSAGDMKLVAITKSLDDSVKIQKDTDRLD